MNSRNREPSINSSPSLDLVAEFQAVVDVFVGLRDIFFSHADHVFRLHHLKRIREKTADISVCKIVGIKLGSGCILLVSAGALMKLVDLG